MMLNVDSTLIYDKNKLKSLNVKKIYSLCFYIAISIELLMELVISISFIKTFFSLRFSFMKLPHTLTAHPIISHHQFFPTTFHSSQKYSFIQNSQL